MLKLTVENYYARMIFASGDNPVSYMHPQLQVCFTVPAIEEFNSVYCKHLPQSFFRNLFAGWNNDVPKFDELSIVNSLGQEVIQKMSLQNESEADLPVFQKEFIFATERQQQYTSKEDRLSIKLPSFLHMI